MGEDSVRPITLQLVSTILTYPPYTLKLALTNFDNYNSRGILVPCDVLLCTLSYVLTNTMGDTNKS